MAPAGALDDPGRSIELSAAILAAGMVSAAALNTLSRRRHLQARHQERGRRIRLPEATLAPTEMALRVAGSSARLAVAHRAVHALARDLARANSAAPTVLGLLAGDEAAEVLLERPAPPPPPWQSAGEGYRWRIAGTDIPVGVGDGIEPLPLLVPLGHAASSDAEVLLNLEACGLVEVSATAARAAEIVYGAAVSLLGLPWAQVADVVLVGFGADLAAGDPRVRCVATLVELTEELSKCAVETDATPLTPGRLGPERQDRTAPTVVLSATPLAGADHEWLESICRPFAPLSALVAAEGPSRARWAIHADGASVFVPQLRLALEPAGISAGDFSAISQIAATALDTAGVTADEPPYNLLASALRNSDEPIGSHSLLSDVAPAAVTVLVLGPIKFCGAGEFRRARSRDIAVYLAMHPDGVSEHQLDEMIWPGRHAVPAGTRDPAVSAARLALGGGERFPYAEGQGNDKRYRLSDQVGTDWDRFCALHRHGRITGNVASLLSALELVRGRPFADVEDGPGWEWLHVEGHLHHMAAEIADAADLAAGLLLEAGQPVEARAAVNRGLLAAPYAERLWVRLMAVADSLGESHEVEALLAEMDRRLGLDGDYDQLHPDTVAAYRRYSRRSPRRNAR